MRDNAAKTLDFENMPVSSWKNLIEDELLCARESFVTTEPKLNEFENCKKIVFPEVDNEG